MRNELLECSRVDISSLLSEDHPHSDPAVLTHLEHCPACRRKLETQAASDEWWLDCQTHLGLSNQSNVSMDQREATVEQHESTWLSGDLSDALAPPSHPELLGRIGRYEVEKVLGRGGMGVVFKAFDTELNRPVAIKVLAPHLAGSGAARERFGREARAAAAVAHEHVVSIHDVEVSAKHPYLVMQYVPGESLQSYVDRHGPLEPGELVRIGHQIAAGLAAAHAQGLVHRDIKPGNIMLENALGRIVITDFGLAQAADDASLTHSGIVAGTPHYMAPEQARGEPADPRTDLFSLGAVLYFMATGHPPFRAEQAMAVLHRICHDRQRPLPQLNANIPLELVSVIDRLLEKKPARRFASASELQQVLAGVLNDIQQPRRWTGKRWLVRLPNYRWQWLIAAIGLLASVLSVGFYAGRQPLAVIDDTEGFNTVQIPTQPSHVSESEEAVLDTAGGQPDFATELRAIHQSLGKIERSPFPETIMFAPFGDSWSREVGAAFNEINRLEKSWPAGYDNPSSLSPLITGEIP
jgi:serine/threonine protein kinase